MPLRPSFRMVREVPPGLVSLTELASLNRLATSRQMGFCFLKSAWIPPRMRRSSVKAVMTMARAPAAAASFMARVWVMEVLTGVKTTLAFFMASARQAGGSSL